MASPSSSPSMSSRQGRRAPGDHRRRVCNAHLACDEFNGFDARDIGAYGKRRIGKAQFRRLRQQTAISIDVEADLGGTLATTVILSNLSGKPLEFGIRFDLESGIGQRANAARIRGPPNSEFIVIR